MNLDDLKIVAPACSLEEARQVLAAGADELYCGAMFGQWVDVFGESDVLSRRQRRPAHVSNPQELAAIAALAHEMHRPAALTLNVRYSQPQTRAIAEIAAQWEAMGGTSLLVSDLGLLLRLRARRSRLRVHLSLLAGTFNSRSAAFFSDLGASRTVLPRHVAIPEIAALIRNGPPVEYEALVLHQKCPFIDGFCGFYHGVGFPEQTPAEFTYEHVGDDEQPVVWSHDPDYEGHGCQLDWQTANGPVRLPDGHNWAAPSCAVCQLADLHQAGVRFLKIAGRGYPTAVLVKAVTFLRQAINLGHTGESAADVRASIRALYADMFGAACDAGACYYPH
jgi:U32 family peptidase